MYDTAKNPRELKDVILRRLGAPVINIEVTETQIYDCIGRALQLYKEYHYDALNKAYIVVVMDDLMADSGYIDLSDYPIFAITKILRSSMQMVPSLGGGASLNWFTDFVAALGGGNSCYHGPNPFGSVGNVGFYAQFSSYQKLLQDQLNPLPDYYFDCKNGILQVNGGKFMAGDALVIECYVQNFVDMDERSLQGIGSMIPIGANNSNASMADKWINPYKKLDQFTIGQAKSNFPTDNVYNERWVKDAATAYTKEVWGNIMAKHQGMQLPGGVTIDGVRLIQEAKEELANLKDEIMLLTGPYAFLVG